MAPVAEDTYDLVVVGAGPAGEKAAAQAAYFGRRVVVVERSPALGGELAASALTTKAMREAALYLTGFRRRMSMAWDGPRSAGRHRPAALAGSGRGRTNERRGGRESGAPRHRTGDRVRCPRTRTHRGRHPVRRGAGPGPARGGRPLGHRLPAVSSSRHPLRRSRRARFGDGAGPGSADGQSGGGGGRCGGL